MPASDFSNIIEECIALLERDSTTQPRSVTLSRVTLPSLLEQCESFSASSDVDDEPIRMIHHLACTGGTLFSKCIAAMPNVQLLSEVAPYSRMEKNGAGTFSPTDLIRLLRSSSKGFEKSVESEVFLSGVSVIQKNCLNRGLRLVLREHSHSKYCWGDQVLEEPGIFQLLDTKSPLRSVVTVRHPLDSYLSLQNLGWVNFNPATLEEYAVRYFAFLADHRNHAIIRYEDLVADPQSTLYDLCSQLDIPFTDDFTELFSAMNLSGDSGRRTSNISSRPRRPIPDEVASQMQAETYRKLCETLGYESP